MIADDAFTSRSSGPGDSGRTSAAFVPVNQRHVHSPRASRPMHLEPGVVISQSPDDSHPPMLRHRTFQPLHRRAPPRLLEFANATPKARPPHPPVESRPAHPPWISTRPNGVLFLYAAPAQAWRNESGRVVRRITPPLPPAESTGPETNPDF